MLGMSVNLIIGERELKSNKQRYSPATLEPKMVVVG